MPREKKASICYILPNYDSATGSHFFYLYELLMQAGGALDIFLVIEKAVVPPKGLPLKVYCQKFSFVPFRMAELLFILARERLRGRKYFYTHYSFFGAYASWLITRIFGGTAYYWNCGMPWLYRRSFFEEAMFRFILCRLILVTGTAGIAKEYAARYCLKIQNTRVLPNWVDTRRFSLSLDKETARRKLDISQNAHVILFVHHLSRRKGSHMIPPVATRVTRVLKNAIFIVVGSGPEYNNLKLEIRNRLPAEALAGAGKVEDSIRLVGDVPNKEIQNYFCAADTFFMPSEEEGFPHVLLEAMATGIPYIASDVGGVREITPQDLQEYLVPSGDVHMFSDKILALADMSDEERKKVVRAEQEWVRQYDIGVVLSKFIALFIRR